jgi:predicted DNA-binding transcriptional regulator AlpA
MMTKENTPLFYSDKELEQKTGLSQRFWQNRRLLGTGPRFIRISNRCVKYQWDDVEKWLTTFQVNPQQSSLAHNDTRGV